MAGAVGLGELADLDEALGYGAGGGLFAGWCCGLRVVSEMVVGIRRGGEGTDWWIG